jgi:hypothetical protein
MFPTQNFGKQFTPPPTLYYFVESFVICGDEAAQLGCVLFSAKILEFAMKSSANRFLCSQ